MSNQNPLQVAMQLLESGQLDRARELLLKLREMRPEHPAPHSLLGVIAAQQKEYVAAYGFLQKAVELSPDNVGYRLNLANVLRFLERFEEAIEQCNLANDLGGELPEALNTKGAALIGVGRLSEAEQVLNRALQLMPSYPAALANLADLKIRNSDADVALGLLRQAYELSPSDLEVVEIFGDLLYRCGYAKEALQVFENAAHSSQDRKIHGKFAKLLSLEGFYANAVEVFERLIDSARSPVERAELNVDLAYALTELRHDGPARDAFQRAFNLGLKADFFLADLIVSKLKLHDWSGLDKLLVSLREQLDEGLVIQPYNALVLFDDPALHWRVSAAFVGRKLQDFASGEINATSKKRGAKVRVGYVSADFYSHPVGHLVARLFEVHDREQFEVIAVSLRAATFDSVEARIRKAVDEFVDYSSSEEAVLPEQVGGLNLDVIVNLMGHTSRSMLGLFAARCAPIQVNFLGYPGTVGADFMDAIVVDEVVVNNSNASHLSEAPLYLPVSFFVNDDRRPRPVGQATRSGFGLPEGVLVYCCFNARVKLTPEVFQSWMRILSRVDGSVLWLPMAPAEARENLIRSAEKAGVSASRLIFAITTPTLAEHIDRLALADVFLDTFPYNAHTTASDSLWAGVPLVTLAGRSIASRVAASLLTVTGMPELVTQSLEEYEALAVRLGNDPELLSEFKGRAVRVRESDVFDTARYARGFEAALLGLLEEKQK